MDSETRKVPQASPELVQANPRVDVDRLREAERVMRELRQRGMEPPKPMVRSPYGERFVRRDAEDR